MIDNRIRAGGIALSLVSASSANAAVINLIDLGGVTGSQAEQGFLVAANYWGSLFTNDVTINLGVGFSALAPNVIAQAGSRQVDLSVATFQDRINATKSNSALDQALVLAPLTGGGISGLTHGVDETGNNNIGIIEEVNGKYSSTVLYTNSSVVKALGGPLSNPNNLDATLTFSSTFGFDFNPGNGVADDTFDFIGVAIHEIGHALGFISGVDFFDYFAGPDGPGTGVLGYDLNDTSIFSALDMFRYSAPGQLDFTVGTESYFSIDGGQTALFGNTFSTGNFQGDGNQASHWVDAEGVNACGPQIGIMDPTFCFGQTGFVTGLDLAAFDAIGWNLNVNALTYRGVSTSQILRSFTGASVPEPSSWAMMIAGFGLVGAVMRRRVTKVTFSVS